MKKIGLMLSLILCSQIQAKELKMKIDYHPKSIEMHVDKKDLGKPIIQELVFTGDARQDYTIDFNLLEVITNEKGTPLVQEIMKKEKKNPRSLVPYIEEVPRFYVKKNKNARGKMVVKTTKDMNGCYFFFFQPVEKIQRNLVEQDQDAIQKSVMFQYQMVSPGYLKVNGTEKYVVSDSIEIEKRKDAQKLHYSFNLDGNCLVSKPRVKIEILKKENGQVVESYNNLKIYPGRDSAILPNTKHKMDKTLNLKKGKYTARIIMYSVNSSFKSFYNLSEKDFEI